MNDALAIEALARIEADPRRWSQDTFPTDDPLDCQTPYCFAGHVAAAAGYTEWRGSAHTLHLLGLDDEAAHLFDAGYHPLFSPLNDLDTLYALVAERSGLSTEVIRDKVQALRPAMYKRRPGSV